MFLSRRYFPLFITQFLGAFNDNFLKNAMVMLITFSGAKVFGFDPAQMVTLTGGIFILPFFIFSATAGQLSDLYDKAAIARWVKVSEIAIMIIAGIGFLIPSFELLLVSLFFMGVHSAFFGPMKYSILPQLLKEEELVAGNAYIEAATFLAILLGTILGGILISIPDLGPKIVSAMLFTIAFIGWLSSKSIPAAPSLSTQIHPNWNFFTSTYSLIGFAKKKRSVWLSILGISWFWCFGTLTLSLFPSMATNVLNGTEGTVTLFLTSFSLGIGIGSILCERMSHREIELGLVPFGAFGLSFGLLFLSYLLSNKIELDTPITSYFLLTNSFGLKIIITLLLTAMFGGFFIVPLYALLQRDSEPSERSRIIAGNNIINALFMAVGSLILAYFQGIGISHSKLFFSIGLLNLFVAFYIFTLIPEFLFRFVLGILCNFMYSIDVRGRENLPKVESAIVVANHVTFVDWLFIAAAVPRPLRFIIDANYCKGFLGFLMKRFGKVIPILPAKENKILLEKAYEAIDRELHDGSWICIFPEGSLTNDGEIKPFKAGVKKIIDRTPVPIIPMGMKGLWGSWFSRQGGKAIIKLPKRFRAHIQINIGNPIPANEVSPENLQNVVQKLIE